MDEKKTLGDMVEEKVDKVLETKYGKAFGASAIVKQGEQVDNSIEAIRFIRAGALANGDMDKASRIAKSIFPNDKILHEHFEKALTATVPSEGGFTVPEILASEIIMPLYNELAVIRAGARRIPMPNGNISIPRIDTKASAAYIGESKPATKTQPVFGSVKLSARKLAALVPFSNDLLRSNVADADTAVRNDLLMVLGEKMDYTAMYGIGSEFTPNGLDALLPSGQKVGSSTTAFTADILVDLYGKLRQANVPMRSPAWIINGVTEAYIMNLKTTTGAYIYRDEMMARKTINSVPYLVSNQVSYTAGSPGYVDLFLGDFSEFLIGEQMALSIETSREASYVDGATTVSAFQNDQTVIRALMLHDFNVRHTASFVKGTYKLATS